MTLTITLQFNAPINVEIDVSDGFDEESLIEALWNDFKNPDSSNSWTPDPSDIEEVIRHCWFEEGAELDQITADQFAVLC